VIAAVRYRHDADRGGPIDDNRLAALIAGSPGV
jgi:hypothetical protein